MRPFFAVALIIIAPLLVHGQGQTEDQKRLMDRHKKKMLALDPARPDRGLEQEAAMSAFYLMRRRAGLPFVEDRIIEYRKQNLMGAWERVLEGYRVYVAVEDVPDRMIPEFVARLEMLKKANSLFHMEYASEFGPRGKAFLPTLQWIRDNSDNDSATKAAGDAIRRIKE